MATPNDVPVLRQHSGEEGHPRVAKKPLAAFLALIGLSVLATVLWIGVLFWMAWQTVGVIALAFTFGPA